MHQLAVSVEYVDNVRTNVERVDPSGAADGNVANVGLDGGVGLVADRQVDCPILSQTIDPVPIGRPQSVIRPTHNGISSQLQITTVGESGPQRRPNEALIIHNYDRLAGTGVLHDQTVISVRPH